MSACFLIAVMDIIMRITKCLCVDTPRDRDDLNTTLVTSCALAFPCIGVRIFALTEESRMQFSESRDRIRIHRLIANLGKRPCPSRYDGAVV